MSEMRFAVIGSGAAAVGTLTSLRKRCPEARITLFDVGRELKDSALQTRSPREWSEEEYEKLHQTIKSQFSLSFPPPKTFFGQGLPKYNVKGYAKPWRSELYGGLTHHWSASIFPFVEKDLKHWPIQLSDLKVYYREIADHVGISGRCDALNSYFGDDYVNRPPIEVPETLVRLDGLINSNTQEEGNYKIISGLNRLAVETRMTEDTSCVYCGECMYGCFRGSIYDAAKSINSFKDSGFVDQHVTEKVLTISSQNHSTLIRTVNGAYSGYDKIFLCAGCFGSAEIIMRSLELHEGVTVKDNNSYVFPIFYFGRQSPKIDNSTYISITNTVLGCVPQDESRCYSHIHISPFADYYWRYYLPVHLWRYFKKLGDLLKVKIILAKMYFPSQVSKSYSLSLDTDKALHVERLSDGSSAGYAREIMKHLRRLIRGKGFVLPPMPLIKTSTSSHYAGSFPYSGQTVNVSSGGEVLPHVYICDSTVFPESPAQPLTLTIMANAARTVREALDG